LAIHPIARGFTHSGVNLSRGITGGLPGTDSTMGLRAEQARVVAGELGLLRQGRSGLPVASWGRVSVILMSVCGSCGNQENLFLRFQNGITAGEFVHLSLLGERIRRFTARLLNHEIWWCFRLRH